MALPQVWTLTGTTDEASLRNHLVDFWISAPSDQIEALFSLPVGENTIKLVKLLTDDYTFSDHQVALRNEIGQYFGTNGLGDPLSLQLMLANFLLSPPGLLKINNISDYFPSWFCSLYSYLYENSDSYPSESASQVSESLSSSPQPSLSISPDTPLPEPDFGPFPSSLHDLLSNRIHLNRLLGLSNLYYIDPEDSDVMKELLEVRLNLSSAIFNCPESDLQHLWSTALGERYWALVRSGIQSVDLSPAEQGVKDKATAILDPSKNGGFGSPGSTNAFLVALMYFLPGSVRVDDPETKIPSWLLPSYNKIFVLN